MAKAEVTEREYNQLISGMKEIVNSIKEFKEEVRSDIGELKTNMQVVEKTYVTKDILVAFTFKLIAWSVTTIVACAAIAAAFISVSPK